MATTDLNLQREIAARRQAEISLQRRLEFEIALSRISSRFVSLTDFDTSVEASLAELGTLVGADRTYLFLLRDNGSIMDNTHEWCSEGASPQRQYLRNLPSRMFPWWISKLRRGESIEIVDVAMLPVEAVEEKAILESQGIRALLVLPVVSAGELSGFLGLDDVREPREWAPEDQAILKTCSDILGSALGRLRAETALRESEARLRLVTENMRDMVSQVDADGIIRYASASHVSGMGYRPDELVGKPIFEFIHPEDASKLEAAFRIHISTGLPAREDVRIRCRDGRLLWLEAVGNPLFDEAGRYTGAVIASRDVSERRQLEIVLRESETRYRSLYEAVSGGIVVQDRDGIVIDANDAVCEIMGLTREQVMRKPEEAFQWRAIREDGDPFPPECHPAVVALRTCSSVRNVIMGICWPESREPRWIMINCEPIKDPISSQVSAVVSNFLEVTDLKRAQAELLSRSSELEAIFRAVPDLYFRLDSDGTILDCQGGRDTEQYCSPKRIIGQRVQRYLPADVRRQLVDAVTEVLSAQAPLTREFAMILAGTERVIEARFSPLLEDQVVVVGRDITQQKRRDDALRDSEERYRTLVDAIDDAISVKDRDGRYVVVNAAFAAWLGMAKQDILGRTPVDLLGSEAGRQMAEQDREVLATRAAVEFEGAFPGQPNRICFVRKVPLLDLSQEPVAVVTVARDMSRYKVMEQQLLRAHRLETAGQVAAQVAHDLKNFLVPLVSCPELLKMQLPEDHPAIAICDTMLEAAKQVASINEDMLTLGSRASADRQPVDLNRVIRQVVDQAVSFPDTLTLQLQLDSGLYPVCGSAHQLARVIANLLSNAREALLDNGTVTVRTSNTLLDRPLSRFNELQAGGYVLLEVIDTGPGIGPEIRNRVFDAFFTTAPDRGKAGLGLGLSIVHAIVEDHHGYVDLTSEPGQGSTFSVYLPVSERKEQVTSRRLPMGTESVLLVDDDWLQRQLFARLLTQLGYTVDVVSDGLEAVDYVARNPVDLVCLDMIMPNGIDGVETYRRIAQVRRGQKAVILSGHFDSSRVKAAQDMGVTSFIQKPVTLEELAREIRLVLDRDHGTLG